MVTPRCFGEGEERFGGLFGHEGQIDVFLGEGPLVGAAEQEQGFGEVDRSGVDVVEAIDQLAVAVVRIVAGDLEQCLRDRQRGAQLVGGIGCESLLFGDVRLEPCEEAVDGVGEILQLVTGPGEREALVQVALGDLPCGRRHRAQRPQDAARDKPAERDRDDRHDRQRDPGPRALVETVTVRATTSRTLAPGGRPPGSANPVEAAGSRRDDQIDPAVAAEDQVGVASSATPETRNSPL